MSYVSVALPNGLPADPKRFADLFQVAPSALAALMASLSTAAKNR